MKKTSLIIIGVIYVASVLLISFFGVNSAIIDPVVPVTQVLCTNVSDNSSIVDPPTESQDYTLIRIRFADRGAWDSATRSGTMLQLQWRVLPDNADVKDVRFEYKPSDQYQFHTSGTGRETGLILFYGKCILDVKIVSTDGTKTVANVKISVW